MLFRQLFDPETSTFTYLLADEVQRRAVIIDPVREQAPRDLTLLEELGLELVATIETHVHADHVTGAWELKQATGCDIIYPRPSGVAEADRLVGEGDTIEFGRHALEVRLTPGHTDGCATYVCENLSRAFTGDALMIRGSGRTDFQSGDSRTLFRSVRDQIFSLPDDTLLYPGHDYRGRTVTTVLEEKLHNPRLGLSRSEDDFVGIMAELELAQPRRIHEAVPANLRLGRPEGAIAQPHLERRWAPVVRSATGAPHIDTGWVREHRTEIRIVDVRQPEEFYGPEGHIEGAELVPLASLLQRAQGWSRQDPMILICRSSGRSDRGALALEQMGFTQVASMVGGMLAWNAGERGLRGTA